MQADISFLWSTAHSHGLVGFGLRADLAGEVCALVYFSWQLGPGVRAATPSDMIKTAAFV